jgi:hypothetical protein
MVLRHHLGEIQYGRYRPVLSSLRDHLTDFIRAHTFEELCRDWVAIKTDLGELSLFPIRLAAIGQK